MYRYLRCFRDPMRVPRIRQNRVPTGPYRVPLTFPSKKLWYIYRIALLMRRTLHCLCDCMIAQLHELCATNQTLHSVEIFCKAQRPIKNCSSESACYYVIWVRRFSAHAGMNQFNRNITVTKE